MKPKTILRWALKAAVLLAAAALLTGVALARTGGDRTLSRTMDQPAVTTLSGGHYQLTGVTLRDAQGRAPQVSDLGVGTIDQPGATTLRGGRYQLTDVTLPDTQGRAPQASDLARGGRYHLRALATGSGCCCTYLPCVVR